MPVSEPLTDNAALNLMVEQLEEIAQALSPQFDAIPYDNDIEVGTSVVQLRAANAEAVKTVVTNLGDALIYLFEDGALSALLYKAQTWTSPLTGAGIISAQTLSSTTTVAIATYTRDSEEE